MIRDSSIIGDVLTYVSAALDKDLVVTGELAAMYAATSGTDSDFVVKLIDVFPAQSPGWKEDAGPGPAQYGKSLNDYQLPSRWKCGAGGI